MEREFLRNLGLEDDVVEKIIAEHGKSTTKIRDRVDEQRKQIADLEASLEKDHDVVGENEQLSQRIESLEQLLLEQKRANNRLTVEKVFTDGGYTEEIYTPFLNNINFDDVDKAKADAEQILETLTGVKEAYKEELLEGQQDPPAPEESDKPDDSAAAQYAKQLSTNWG